MVCNTTPNLAEPSLPSVLHRTNWSFTGCSSSNLILCRIDGLQLSWVVRWRKSRLISCSNSFNSSGCPLMTSIWQHLASTPCAPLKLLEDVARTNSLSCAEWEADRAKRFCFGPSAARMPLETKRNVKSLGGLLGSGGMGGEALLSVTHFKVHHAFLGAGVGY